MFCEALEAFMDCVIATFIFLPKLVACFSESELPAIQRVAVVEVEPMQPFIER